MKRHVLMLCSWALVGCGGGNVGFALTSDDAGENVQSLVSGPSVDLTTVKSVKLTVQEVWVHVGDDKAPDTVKGEEVEDGSTGWTRVVQKEQPVDLMTLRNQTASALREGTVPVGKVTQVRLKLKAQPEGSDQGRIPGAVEEADGTVCDLLVPRSAYEPGVKIAGAFRALQVQAGSRQEVVLNLRLKDSARLTESTGCAYRLNPVLKVKEYKNNE